MWSAILNIFSNLFGWLNKRNSDVNTPEMKEAKKRELNQKEIDNFNKIVKEKRLDEIRRNLS